VIQRFHDSWFPYVFLSISGGSSRPAQEWHQCKWIGRGQEGFKMRL
jgi:hypothetical protein